MHRPTPEFPDHLRALYLRFPFDRSLADDPVALVRTRATSSRSGEVAGITAATLAVGGTTAIQRAFEGFVGRVGQDLSAWTEASPAERRRALHGFAHRWIRGDQLAYLGDRLSDIYGRYGTLEAVFRGGMDGSNGFAGGIDALSNELRGNGGTRPPRGYRNLFPSPLAPGHSACKRMTLFVRWMVRSGFPDLGLWHQVPTGELRIPLDQHVYWIAYHLGLTRRRTRNWPTVEEVTESLRRIDPVDPAKFDFVLCHTGISGDCPKERDLSVCGPCVVRPDCLLWRRVRMA